MVLALRYFDVCKYRILLFFVFSLFFIHFTNLASANYQPISLPGDNYISPSPLQVQEQEKSQDIDCHYSPELLDIEIGKINLSTQEEDVFQFYVEMTDLQVDPSHLSYKWVVESPSDSMVSSDYRLTLRPEQWGTYSITLVLEDSSQNCKYTVYIFQYPEADTDDLEFVPSVHALFGEMWTF